MNKNFAIILFWFDFSFIFNSSPQISSDWSFLKIKPRFNFKKALFLSLKKNRKEEKLIIFLIFSLFSTAR